MPEVGKEEDLGRKSLKQKTQNKFLCKSDSKERVKNYLFFSLIVKARFRIRYFSKDKKIRNSVASNFF